MKIFNELNKEQKKIVLLNSGKHIVLAPPGTGKTDVLSKRFLNAICLGVDENKMLNLTFTNRAAREMNDRVKDENIKHKAFIGNIHTFCLEILKNNLLLNNATVLVDESEQSIILKEVIQQAKLIYLLTKIIDFKKQALVILNNEISTYRTRGFSNLNKYPNLSKIDYLVTENDEIFNIYIDQISNDLDFLIQNFKISDEIKMFLIDSKDSIFNQYIKFYIYKEHYKLPEKLLPPKESFEFRKEQFIIEICKIAYPIYVDELSKINGIDFDDIIIQTYLFLCKNNNIKYNWLQVDETQDLNPLQWSIIEKILDENSHIVLFGDFEQSIYSFLGAEISILKEITEKYQIHHFNINYRSPSYLLEIYKSFSKEFFEPLWSTETNANCISLPEKDNLIFREIEGYNNDEITYVVEKIIPYYVDKGNTAILVRFNNTANQISRDLTYKGMNHFKISGFDIFKSSLLKTIIDFFNCLHKPYSRSPWFRMFSMYSNISSIKKATKFVTDLFDKGLLPLDLLNPQNNHLKDLSTLLKQGRIVVFDTETTGLDTVNDDIIQIAAIEIVNGVIGNKFEVFINTDIDTTESEKIHKISKEHLKTYGIEPYIGYNNFLNFVGNSTLVAHNLKYDKEILAHNLKRHNVANNLNPFQIDTLDITKRLYPKLPSYKLEYLLETLKIDGINSHNAMDDVIATCNLVISLANKLEEVIIEQNNFLASNFNTVNSFNKQFKELYFNSYNAIENEVIIKEYIEKLSSYFITKNKVPNPANFEKFIRFSELKIKERTLKSFFDEWLDKLSTYKESDLLQGDENLMIATIHKSKGLQFDNVIIVNCNEGIYPYGDNIAEEQRLFYVALTRAKKRIIITSHTKSNKPSSIEIEGKKFYKDYTDTSISKFVNPILKHFNYRINK